MLPKFNPISEDEFSFALEQFLKEILLTDKGNNAQYFFSYSNFEPFFQILIQKLLKNPKKQLPLKSVWALLSYYNRFFKQIDSSSNINFEIISELNFSDEFSLKTFTSSSESAFQTLSPYITKKKDLSKIQDSNLKNILSSFLFIRDKYPSLYFSIYSHIKSILSVFSYDRIQNLIGSQSFSLYNHIPSNNFNNIQLGDTYDDLLLYFSNPINFTFPDFTQKLQKTLTISHKFPFSFPNIPDSDYFSWVNTSILQKLSLLEIFNSGVIEKFINGDYSGLSNFLKTYPNFATYIIVINRELFYSNLDEIAKYPILIQPEYIPSIATDTCIRFFNDYQLIQIIRFLSGVDVAIPELLNHSIPYFLHNVLYQSQILDYSNLNYFSYSDEEIFKDFDFIHSYAIMRLILTSFNSPELKNNISIIKTHLNAIKNHELRKGLLLDLFSLIFLKKQIKATNSI